MASTTKLLKFINKHPNCSYIDIADKFYNGDIYRSSIDLLSIIDYIDGYGMYDTKHGSAIKTISKININSLGKELIDNSFKEKIRFYGPFFISILALTISAISLFISIKN
ncbi:MAG: hypothetical protein RR538_09145 [Erysipelotrichaceae bacterium]